MAKANESLRKARDLKNDEFYTQLTDIEKELKHYKKHFKGKVVFCNCDDPTWSEFWRYFHLNFHELELKKLISTHFDANKNTYKLEYLGGNDNDIDCGTKTALSSNGDFKSEECLELLKQSDIVVTNPPFSLFRSYISILMEHHKKFIIIGSKNVITYKEFFPLLRDNKVWIGFNNVQSFGQPDGTIKKFGNIGWYTNLDISKRHEKLILWKNYNTNDYKKYENYDAINIDKVNEIPFDYSGVMGVPITFLDKYNPEQFEIVGLGIANLGLEAGVAPYKPHHKEYRKNVQKKGQVDGDLYMVDEEDHPIVPYARILIRKR